MIDPEYVPLAADYLPIPGLACRSTERGRTNRFERSDVVTILC